MNQKTPKAVLLAKIAELTSLLNAIPNPLPIAGYHTLKRNAELPLCSGVYGDVDLREVDSARAAIKRRAANELADELIRSGAVSFKETLVRDQYRYGTVVRIEATLKVAA